MNTQYYLLEYDAAVWKKGINDLKEPAASIFRV
jgi:hypothetical protein